MAIINDIDGNVYNTIKIGTQEWTTNNFKGTKFFDGTPIPLLTANADWSATTTPTYCYLNNDPSYNDTHGKLYNGHTASASKELIPLWSIPSSADFNTLTQYLIDNGYNHDGTSAGNKIAKSLSSKSSLWTTSITSGNPGNDISSNNKSCWSAYPSGWRALDGTFYNFNDRTYFWNNTQSDPNNAFSNYLLFNAPDLKSQTSNIICGFSIRLCRTIQ